MLSVSKTIFAGAAAMLTAIVPHVLTSLNAEPSTSKAFSAKPVPETVYIPRTGWTLRSVDSAETGNPGTAAFDGNPATLWHTRYTGGSPAHPHEIQIDMGSAKSVSGFTYVPRQDFCSNGIIKDFQFYTSLDGVNWGAVASSGTFTFGALPLTCPGTMPAPERVVTFSARSARYLRLVALNEVNGGPWTSVAELNVIDGTAGNLPANRGRWGNVITTSVNPVGAAALPDGKVLIWSSFDRYTFGTDIANQTLTAIFDPATGTATERMVVETAHDMFCPGTSFLGDGRLLVTGGDTAAKSSIYNPGTATWTSGGNMNLPRGYQGQTVLDDGSAFVMGGSWSGGSLGKNGEVWSNGVWRYLPNTLASVTLGPDPGGAAIADRHPWVFGIGNGKVAHVGPSVAMNIYDTTVPNGSTTAAGNRTGDVFSQNGTAVMYDIGKILKAGGAPAYGGANATANAYIIDVSNGITPTRTGSMRLARGMHNTVVMPNGEVMVIGGMPVPNGFSDVDSIFVTEIWNPSTGNWRDEAPISIPRNYHSVALLLPDGRILSGGGGLCGQGCSANHSDVQIFSPAYLFKGDGSPAVRPVITQAPATALHNGTIDITVTGAATQFSMVRFGAVTHSVNTDQRRVPLTPQSLGNGVFRLAIPGAGAAPPGNYMLFAMDANGTPSIARTVLVQAPPRPTVTIAAPASGANFVAPASVVINASVTDPAGNVTRVEFYNGTTLLGQDTTAPYTFTWPNVATGAYTLRATVVDATGFTASSTTPITVSAAQTFTNTATAGTAGAPFTGTAFELRCQASEVLAGVAGRSSAYVDQAGPLCVAVSETGAWRGSPVARGTAGGSGGTAFTRTCPANQAVVGFRGRSGAGLDQLDVACQPLSSGGNVSGTISYLGPVGGTGGGVVNPISCTAPRPAAGIRGVGGTYVGTFGLSCAVPAIVPNRAPVISLTSPANNATYIAPADIVISANVSDPDNNLAKVEFFNGSTKLGERTAAPFTFNWTSVLSGTYAISAVATDTAGSASTASANVTVNAPAGSPPEPAALSSYVSNRAVAIALGKALFWDTQVGSDGRTACASCHFQAGADLRFKGQSNPGMNREGVSSFSFAPTKSGAAASGPNYRMTAADFPTYVLSDPLNGNSAVVFQTTDVVGSQGLNKKSFTAAVAGQAADSCSDVADPVFGGFRQVTARNSPTVINSVYNHRNFYDGRANNVFNGVDETGNRNSGAVIYRGAGATPTRIALENASLASQAVVPPVSGIEMSCAGRSWPDIGRRLLKAKPLSRQAVAATDSVLASYVTNGVKGLNGDYEAMVKAAFANDLWSSTASVSVGGRTYSQIEANFSLFFGLAVQLYQATLISDDAPIDRYFGTYPATTPANPSALTAEQIQGLSIFQGKGNCISCHSGPQLTNAGTPAHQAAQNGVLADRMFQGNGAAGVYDFGFYNIGLRTTAADLGLGGTDAFGNPLSFTRQAVSGVFKDTFSVVPCAFSTDACTPVTSSTRAVVDGAFKTPGLRNVALTGPYFHDGSRATLEEVVDFYVRATDVRTNGGSDSTGFGANSSNLAGGLPRIELSAGERQALLAFLKVALTDDRVAFERAPFDHPELPLTDGSPEVVLVPAVGQAGRATAVSPFVNLVSAGGLGYPPVPNVAPAVTNPGTQSTAVNSAVSLQIAAVDPEGDGMTYQAAGLPTGLSIGAGSGLISGTATAAGSFAVTVTVRDTAANATNVNFTWNVTTVVPPAVTVSMTAPANNATFTLPTSITMTATASQAGGGTITRVEFYDGATLLNSDTAAPFEYVWPSATAGPRSLTARAFGSVGGASATSAAVNITVNNPASGCAFPSVPVTDNFNRANGGMGGQWIGATGGFSISGNQVTSLGGDSFMVVNQQLGADQEAYVKLTNIHPSASEIDLILKAGGTNWNSGALVVSYQSGQLQVWTYDPATDWVLRSGFNVTVVNGDTIGARVRGASGAVEVYRNGALVGTASVAGWVRQTASGMAGMWVVSPAGTTFDDFGGGNLTCSGGGNVAPTVSITGPAAGAVFTAPAAVTITANAADSDGTVSRVEFFQGAVKLGEDLTSPYSFAWSGVAAGTYSLTARATDSAGAVTTSAAVNITVNAPGNVAPTVSITGPAAGAVFTAPASVTITANAADSDGTVSRVEFFQGAVKLGEDLTAPYSFAWSGVAAGTYSLTARATDSAGAATTSAAVNITVNAPGNVAPTVSITGPAAGAVFTAPAAVTITANAADSDGTVSRVEFFQGAVKLGEDLTAPYSFAWSGVSAGTYSLTARATDSAGAVTTSAAVSITVNAPGNVAPTVSITGPAAGAVFTAPAAVTITANAADSDGTVSRVEFFQGAVKLGEDLTSPYSFAWSGVAAGTYSLTARATDSAGAATTSAAVSITVNAPGNVAPTVSITGPAAGAVFTAPAAVNINANAADSDGTVSRVEFFQGAVKLGEDLTSPYQFAWTNVAAGTYSLTARATDSAGAVTTSAAVSITVNAPGACGFPSITAITDTFNRANGAIGGSWAGSTGGYSISNNQMVAAAGDQYVVWNQVAGPAMEASVRLTAINTAASEIDVVLKSMGTDWYSGAVLVSYLPGSNQVQVWSTAGGNWTQHNNINVQLVAGDVLGGRIRTNGTVEVYRNGALIGTTAVTGWPHLNGTGFSGVWVVGGAGTSFDDFRAGTLICP
jgi:cytochrome c peroxidase